MRVHLVVPRSKSREAALSFSFSHFFAILNIRVLPGWPRVLYSRDREGSRMRRVTPPDTVFLLQHTEPGAGAVSAVYYTGDSKTDELIKISTIFGVPPPPGHVRILAQN